MKTIKETIKYAHILTENSIKCRCGRNVAMNPKLDKEICTWCGNYIFRTPKDEFKHRMKERMIKNARK